MNSEVLRSHLALLIAAIIYGVNYFITHDVFNVIPPFAVLALRTSIAALIFVSFGFKSEKIEKEDFPRLIVSALFGISINQACFLWGLSRSSTVNSSILMITSPIFLFLFAWFSKGEKVTLGKIIGVVLAFLGAFFLIVNGKTVSFGKDSMAGDIVTVLNAISYSVYLIIVRPLIDKYNIITLFKWLFLIGAIVNIPLGLSSLLSISWTSVPTEAYLQIAYIGIFTTGIAYFLNGWAMRKLPASSVGLYVFLQPVFVTLIALGVMKEVLSSSKMLCILSVWIGVFMVSFKKQATKLPSEKR